MKRICRIIAGLLAVMMVLSSFPVLAMTESVRENYSSTSSQAETVSEDLTTFDDDASDISSHESSAVSEQEEDAPIEDASDSFQQPDSNEESTQQQEEVLDKEECNQPSLDEVQLIQPDVDTGKATTGTAIKTAAQLQAIGASATSLAGSYYLAADIDLGANDQLPKDPNNNFTAIGTKDQPFMGTFDGNNHVVKNIQISTTTDYQGLFGYIGEDAVVQNVSVTGSVSGAAYVGGIAGCVYGTGKMVEGALTYVRGSVTKSYNQATVTGSGENVGGIAGYANGGSVTNCYNTAVVKGSRYAGGIAGRASGILENCYNTAPVVGSYAGGITGLYSSGSGGAFKNCYYNTGNSGQATGAAGGGTVPATVKGLTTVQMTGPQALTNMAFTSETGTWTAASKAKSDKPNANGDYTYYYPQLTNFVTNASTLTQFYNQVFHDFAGKLSPVAGYITTAAQLQAINNQPLGSYVLLNDIDLSRADQLPNDADNNFTAIGSTAAPFRGNFDGKSHEIQNIQISIASSSQGLFGYLGNNVSIINVGVTGSICANNDVGGIVGEAGPNAIITNCYNKATITPKAANSSNMGGIVGRGAENISVTNCYNKAPINTKNTAGGIVGCFYKVGSITNCYNEGEINAGGSTGGILGSTDNVKKSSITDCYNAARVISTGRNVGGIAGYIYDDTTIKNCYNTMEVYGTAVVGGLVGAGSSYMSYNCYYNTDYPGDATQPFGNSNSKETVKGLTTTQMTGPQALTNMVFTSKTGTWTAASKVKSDKPNAYGDYSYYYPQLTTFVTNANDLTQFYSQVLHAFSDKLAPVAGYITTAAQLQAINNNDLYGNYVLTKDIDLNLADQLPNDPNNNFTAIGTKENSFNGYFDGQGYEIQNIQISTQTDYQGLFGYVGFSSCIQDLSVTGSVSGASAVGGIAGYIEGTIKSCYNTAKVTGSNSKIGGVVGENAGTVINCYNIAEVEISSANGDIGGVVGYNSNNITNCYNIAKVSKTSSQYTGNIGGVLGFNSNGSGIINCVYNTDYAGDAQKAVGYDDGLSSYSRGLTSTQMTGQQALTNMHFSDTAGVWSIYSKADSTQPNAYGDYSYYYPQLTAFVTNVNDSNQFYSQTLHDFNGVMGFVKAYITTAAELQAINNDLKGNYVLLNDIDLSAADQLPDDANNNFKTLGTANTETLDTANSFKGYFDGRGHKIKNLQISTTTDCQGLFGGVATEAMIMNVAVTGSISGKNYVGGIAGWSMGSITNCYNMATIKGSSRLGGILGHNRGSVANCYNTGTVTGSGNYIGGIAGSSEKTITNCYNTAEVFGDGIIGGVMGTCAYSTTTNCVYNTDYAGDATRVIGQGTAPSTVKGLTSEKMTERQALTNMGFSNTAGVWSIYSKVDDSKTPNAYGDYTYYYPQLTVFVTDVNDPNQFYRQTPHDFDGAIGFVTGYITTAAELQAINNDLDGKYVLTKDIDLKAEDQLPNDPDNNFTPIGTYSSAPFVGWFDGNGHEIQNIQISTTTGRNGLFAYAKNPCRITRLGITGNISGNGSVGGIVGELAGTSTSSEAAYILHCYNAATLSSSNSYVGGIVCIVQNSSAPVFQIEGCYNTAAISGENFSAAGIIAYTPSAKMLVKNCYNTGTITGKGSTGGIIGWHADSTPGRTTITNCYNTGSITVTSNASAGGIGGQFFGGTITNCYNTGSVTSFKHAGGIAGSAGQIKSAISIETCYNTGAVTGTNTDASDAYIGGITGYLAPNGSISDCYNIGNIGDEKTGKNRVGGIVGYAGVVDEGTSSIQNCYNAGTAYGTTTTYVGALVGLCQSNSNNKVIISNCYYDDNYLGAATQAIGTSSSSTQTNVSALTAVQMTGPQALSNMVFTSATGTWVAASKTKSDTANAYGDYTYYYPQLKAFVSDTSDVSKFPSQMFHDFAGQLAPVTGYISTAAQLQALNAAGCGNYVLLNNIDLKAADQLPDDANNNFTAIGSYNRRFRGYFDGKGYEIQNLQISTTTSYQGLFGYALDKSLIVNLSVTGSVTGDEFVGGVVGYMGTKNRVENCSSAVNINGNRYVGGVAGYLASNGWAENCSNAGNVTGVDYVGGVVGHLYKSGRILNCHNVADITSTNTGSSQCGGIVGYVNSENRVEGCSNTGNVSGVSCIGGIAGWSMGVVTKCYNTGMITGIVGTLSVSSAGGILGFMQYSNTEPIEIYVSDCYNIAPVTAPHQGVGGIVGRINSASTAKVAGSVQNCYNVGAVNCGDSYYVGGVVGYCIGSNETKTATISNCYYNADSPGKALNPVGGGYSTQTNVSALTTVQMTGPQALSNMVFTSAEDTWVAASKTRSDTADEYGDYAYYYPQLQIFVSDPSDVSQFPSQMLHDFAGQLAPVTAHISTAAQLQAINNQLAGNYVLLNDIDLSQADQLPDDANNNFTAIGGTGSPFSGKFDGNGHKIQNLQISATPNYQGLFGSVGANSTIMALSVTGSVSGVQYVGGIAGSCAQFARIINCHNAATVTATVSYCGGITGHITSGRIENCSNTASVSGNKQYIAGIAGYIYGDSVITDSYNTGNITGDSSTGDIGGIVGRGLSIDPAKLSIVNCYNTATVTAGGYGVGGIIGFMVGGSLTNSYNTGNINGGSAVGGLSGVGRGKTQNAYNMGTVTGSEKLVGGLVGIIDGTSNNWITDCYSAGKVTGGDSQVGNLVGSSVGPITNCYYNIELADPSVPDIGESTETVTNSGARYTMQMTGSNAIGTDGMQFSDASAWKMTANTDSLAYYPSISGIATEQPVSKPYYTIAFDVDSDCTLVAEGFDPNGNVVDGGHYIFTVSREDLSIPMEVLLNGEQFAPLSTEGNTSTFMIDNITAPQKLTVTLVQQIDGLRVSGEGTMECGTTQTLTLTFEPADITNRNKAVTWSVVEGSTGNVTFSEQTSDNVVVQATQIGNVTVRATSQIDNTVYADFAITITQGVLPVVFPTQATIDYGQPLAEATFVGGEGEGTFQYKEKDRLATDQDNGVAYTVVFTPTDSVNYKSLEADVPLTIRLQITNMLINASVENRNPSTNQLLVMKNSYQQFTPEVQGHGLTAENSLVDWSLTGAESPETVIDQTGKVTVSKDETARVLQISITSQADPTKTATQQLIVCNLGDFEGNLILNAMDRYLLIKQIELAAQPDYVFNPFYDLNHDNVIDAQDDEVFLKLFLGIVPTFDNL